MSCHAPYWGQVPQLLFPALFRLKLMFNNNFTIFLARLIANLLVLFIYVYMYKKMETGNFSLLRVSFCYSKTLLS